ncbi:hypothetical protein Aple_039330 [Acrocarpospora pleiomorpha]|uniref:Uncharacterized protein n=1 Tax=Acrocarpospora pleiomorpha TaxID=90975 RepID=A0A5M3XHQ4_9ACTN|nr:caspase family protein [Acrocarpospora pleiomorpha]GES21037.1 hypothetical protein Aple_039330 [Acrocarpospora pleiomorpha]
MDQYISPERTWAIVVAVEQYDAGKSWDLPGPGNDAARFVSWLRRCGVPNQQILCYASLLDESTAARSALGLIDGPPTHYIIDRLLTQRARDLEGDLLWFYWAGHGAEGTDENQRLFLADKDRDNGRNLNLGALLRSYRTDFVRIPRQIFLVDACRTMPGSARAAEWSSIAPPAGPGRPAREQTVIVAARAGGQAYSENGSGRFSTALMDVLDTAGPADMREVFQQVHTRMADGSQQPWWLHYRDAAGEEHHANPAQSAAPAPAPRRSPPGSGPTAAEWAEYREVAEFAFNTRTASYGSVMDGRADLEAELREPDDQARLGQSLNRGRPHRRQVLTLRPALAATGRRTSAEERRRVVLLTGGPGSGKSTALLDLVRDAFAAPQAETPMVPVYVDLRGFRPSGPVTADAVRAEVLAAMKAGGSGAVADFVDTWFDHGLKLGWWQFLFDSFDEIPALLSAHDPAAAAEHHAAAILAFLYDLTPCGAVVATRDIAGYTAFQAVPRLRILPMSERVRGQLLERFGSSPATRRRLESRLATAPIPIQEMADNPLLLSLLYRVVTADPGGWFPTDRHDVLDHYVREQLGDAPSVMAAAAEIALAMSHHPSLSLNPSIRELCAALTPEGGAGPAPDMIQMLLESLQSAKLGAYTALAADRGERRFSFVHRAVQEYFVTVALLARPHRVPAAELLTESRWHPAAVSLLRRRSSEVVGELTGIAGTLLAREDLPDDDDTPWRETTVNLLATLADGFAPPSPHQLPDALRVQVGHRLLDVWPKAGTAERVDVVRFASAADPDTENELLGRAFHAHGTLLRDTAFRQAVSRPVVPAAVLPQLRRTLLTLEVERRLRARRRTIRAQLRGSGREPTLLNTVRLLRVGQAIDLLVCLALGPTLYLIADIDEPAAPIGFSVVMMVLHLGYRAGLRRGAWPGAAGTRRLWWERRFAAFEFGPDFFPDYALSIRHMIGAAAILTGTPGLLYAYLAGTPITHVFGWLGAYVVTVLVGIWPSAVREGALHGHVGPRPADWLRFVGYPVGARARRSAKRLVTPRQWWPEWLRPSVLGPALARIYGGRYRWLKITGGVAAAAFFAARPWISAEMDRNPVFARLVVGGIVLFFLIVVPIGTARYVRPWRQARRDRLMVEALCADLQRADPGILTVNRLVDVLAELRTAEGFRLLVDTMSTQPPGMTGEPVIPIDRDALALLGFIAHVREVLEAFEPASEDDVLVISRELEPEWAPLFTESGSMPVVDLAQQDVLDAIAALRDSRRRD